MVYRLIPRRLSFFILIFIVLLWNILTSYYGASFSMFLAILLLAIGLASFSFKFTITDDHFEYQITLFNRVIMQKVILPDEVQELKFIRVGWAKKAAILQMHQGLPIRLDVLEPQHAYEHLHEFAREHRITIQKTKDYLILERMNGRS